MNKRILSLVLALVMVLGSGGAFAATENGLELTHKVTNVKHDVFDVLLDFDLLWEVAGNLKNYTVKVNGVTYNAQDVQDEFDKNPAITIEDAVKNLSPYVPGETEELKVIDVSAINNTSVTVKFNETIEGEVAVSDFTFDNGLTVVSAAKSLSGESVTLVTSPQLEGTIYKLSYKGEDTAESFTGKKADVTNEFAIDSAQAHSNTSVVLILDDAPLRNLNASDFTITPALNILSVTTTDNVVTLKTSPQTDGVSYTIAAINGGSGSATFTGQKAVTEQGILKNVKVENLRQIRVEFTEPLLWSTAKLADNYYLGLTEETAGDTKTNSLTKYTKWEVTPGTQSVLASDAKVEYVIIESKTGELINDTIVNGGLDLQYNKSATLEVRNLKRDYINTSQATFTVVDPIGPKVASKTNVAEPGRLAKDLKATIAANKFNYLDYEDLGEKDAYVFVEFNEPIRDTKQDLNTVLANTSFRVYVDGIELGNAPTTSTKAFIVQPDIEGDAAADVVRIDKDVFTGKVMLLNVTDLSVGEHTLKIVGAQDLKGNVMSPNPYETKFTVIDEGTEIPDPIVKPNVIDVKQVADNALEIEFDQPGVEYTTSSATLLLEKSEYHATEGWKDITVDLDDTNVVTEDIYNLAETKVIGTRWIVVFDAVADKATTAVAKFNYDGQGVVFREIVLKGYQTTILGDTYRKDMRFVKDVLAPVIDQKSVYHDTDKGLLFVKFNDKPFATPNGEIALVKDKIVRVSVTTADNKTAFQEIAIENPLTEVGLATDAQLSAAGVKSAKERASLVGRTVVIDVSAYQSTATVQNLVTETTAKLFNNAVYTVEFAQGAVTDAEEVIVADDATTNLDLVNLDELNEIIKSSTSIKIGKADQAEGRVPQTTKGLIQSGLDIAKTENGAAIPDATPGMFASIEMANNPNKIIIVFDGEVAPETAKNVKNYSINGNILPQGTVITYNEDIVNSEVSISATNLKAGYAIITLPENTISKTGLYDITISGITNKSGKRMLPVEDVVGLVDNSGPVAKSVKVKGSKQLEITFDEGLEILDPTKVLNNFEVIVDGTTIAVNAVNVVSGEINKLMLTLAQDMDLNADLSKMNIKIKVKNDSNGNMYIADEVETIASIVIQNVAKEGTVTNK